MVSLTDGSLNPSPTTNHLIIQTPHIPIDLSFYVWPDSTGNQRQSLVKAPGRYLTDHTRMVINRRGGAALPSKRAVPAYGLDFSNLLESEGLERISAGDAFAAG